MLIVGGLLWLRGGWTLLLAKGGGSKLVVPGCWFLLERVSVLFCFLEHVIPGSGEGLEEQVCFFNIVWVFVGVQLCT